MHKGMTQQIFIFIFALIMMALVLLFGVRQLSVVTTTADKVETLVFIDDFTKEIQSYTNFDIGSSKQVRLSLPSGINQVCFFDPKQPVQGISDPVFRALLEGDKKNNLYVLPLEEFQNPGPGFIVPHLITKGSHNPFCVLTPNGFRVIIETVAVDNTIAVAVRES